LGEREERSVPMVKLESRAGQAIRSFFSEKGLQRPLRIHLQSRGCCDASLCLSVDTIRESDLIKEVDGLVFVISPETLGLVGEVRISYRDESGKIGFVLTSSRPVSEWEGFGVSSIRI